MAKRGAVTDETTVDETADVSTSPEGWEWETVAEESAATVVFDTIGDVFIGEYLGSEHIEPENGKRNEQSGENEDAFDRFVFRARDGKRYAINKSYKLNAAMEDVDEGQWVRITYVADIETSRKLNPMKDFRVDVRK